MEGIDTIIGRLLRRLAASLTSAEISDLGGSDRVVTDAALAGCICKHSGEEKPPTHEAPGKFTGRISSAITPALEGDTRRILKTASDIGKPLARADRVTDEPGGIDTPDVRLTRCQVDNHPKSLRPIQRLFGLIGPQDAPDDLDRHWSAICGAQQIDKLPAVCPVRCHHRVASLARTTVVPSGSRR